MNINWGILGCGGIATTFINGMRDAKKGSVYACAARNVEKADAFASEHHIPNVHASYQALLADENVDAVYVATTHNAHFDCVKQSLEAGKHVLCEKPLTVNAKQAEELVALASAKQRFLMEAVWIRFLPAIRALKKDLQEGVIGNPVTVKADFSLCRTLPESHRLRDPQQAGGALLDLGIYPLTMASLVFEKPPTKIMGHAVLDSTGVDQRGFYTLDYGEGKTALLTSGYTQDAPCEAVISGDKGHIIVPQFLGTHRYTVAVQGEESVEKVFPFEAHQNFLFEIEHAHECIEQGLTQSPILPLSTSVELLHTMDELRRQFGVSYSFD